MKKAILLTLLWLGITAIDAPQPPTEPNPDDGFIHVKGTEEGKPYPFTADSIPIYLSDFHIAPTEVTLAQMALYCYDNGLDLGIFHEESWGAKKANRAAVNANWFDAIRYCNWLSEQAGFKNLAYDIYGIVEGEERMITAQDSVLYFAEYAHRTWSKIE